MKKLLFTTMALVAFSGISNGKTNIKIKVAKCDATFNSVYIYSRNQGFSDQEANKIAFAAYDKCMGCDSTRCTSIK